MSIIKKLTKNSSKGFTLVELLVVIAIIGVLATLILLQLGAARQKARDAKRVADINQVRSAVELYFDDNSGHYPNVQTLNDNLVNVGKYMTLLPVDPLAAGGCGAGATANYNGTGGCYGYAWSPNVNPGKFHLWAELERYSTALTADIDFNSLGASPVFNGAAVNGASEAQPCADTNVQNQNCVYDVGVTQ